MSLKSHVEVVLTALQVTSQDFADAGFPLAIRRALDLDNGAGANQANVLFSDQRTLAPSASENLDFNGGGLLDALGNAVLLARVRAILIYASPANVNNLTLFGNANSIPLLNTAATTMSLPPGGLLFILRPDAAGAVVTAATGDIIQVANAGAGTSVTYDIVVLGSST
jgi:hypothetical protein